MARISNASWRMATGFIRLAAGQVALLSQEANIMLYARLDDGYPQRQDGYGGWEDEARPGQVSATVFRGAPAQRLPLRLILGGYPVDPRPAGQSCTTAIRYLEELARQPVGARRGDRPPLIRVKGNVPHAGRLWFVDDLEWGEGIVVRGNVVRTHVTVTLKRFVPVQLVRLDNRRREPPPVRYRVKSGDSLQSIARDQLMLRGSRAVLGGTRRIRELNRIRGVRPGQWIMLPPMSVGHGDGR